VWPQEVHKLHMPKDSLIDAPTVSVAVIICHQRTSLPAHLISGRLSSCHHDGNNLIMANIPLKGTNNGKPWLSVPIINA
jgi:hypothetical protein